MKDRLVCPQRVQSVTVPVRFVQSRAGPGHAAAVLAPLPAQTLRPPVLSLPGPVGSPARRGGGRGSPLGTHPYLSARRHGSRRSRHRSASPPSRRTAQKMAQTLPDGVDVTTAATIHVVTPMKGGRQQLVRSNCCRYCPTFSVGRLPSSDLLLHTHLLLLHRRRWR